MSVGILQQPNSQMSENFLHNGKSECEHCGRGQRTHNVPGTYLDIFPISIPFFSSAEFAGFGVI